MGRAYRFGVVVTLVMFAVVSHYVGIEMFASNGVLWDLVDPANSPFVDTSWREDLERVFTFHLPLALLAFATAWLFLSEYEAQTVTRRTRRRR